MAAIAGASPEKMVRSNCRACRIPPPNHPDNPPEIASRARNAHCTRDSLLPRFGLLGPFGHDLVAGHCSRLVARTEKPVDDPGAPPRRAAENVHDHGVWCGVPRALPPLPQLPSVRCAAGSPHLTDRRCVLTRGSSAGWRCPTSSSTSPARARLPPASSTAAAGLERCRLHDGPRGGQPRLAAADPSFP